ncbi:Frizzled/Smoothened transmembrane domain [Trinorchestia longiramus]|nr:Frizzled/Smoothened transmembrane domain [Trinorchestia longiramus]
MPPSWPMSVITLHLYGLLLVNCVSGTASGMAVIEQVMDPPWQTAETALHDGLSAHTAQAPNSDVGDELHHTTVQYWQSSTNSTSTPVLSSQSSNSILHSNFPQTSVNLSSNSSQLNVSLSSNYSSFTETPALSLDGSSPFFNVTAPDPLAVYSGDPLSRSTEQDFPQIADQEDLSCVAVEKCELLQYSECLGATLPYTHTSLATTRLHSQRAAYAELQAWSRSLRQIPRCWGVVQPYLCSVFFPPCVNATNILYVPPKDMCEAVRGPCGLVEEGRGWPSYMLCPDTRANHTNAQQLRSCSTSSSIASSLREVKFNSSSGVCVPPLVPTPRPEAWYEGIRGCALPCHHPHFSREETAGFHSFLALMGGLCVACCTFTVLTYLLEWRCGGSRRYPSVLLLYVCGCCLVAGVALLVQYHATVRQRVTCHGDGTLRTHEPSTESNMSCVVVFVCLYYFGIAAATWLLILSYSWHCFFTQLVCGERGVGGGSGGGEKGSAYYHLVAWSLPLVLTITTLAMGQVSADNLHGVCFLSPSLGVRLPLLLVPLTLVLIVTAFFISKGILRLCQLKLECNNILTTNDNTKIVESIVRLAVLLLTLAACGAFTLYSHWHYYSHYGRWQLALRQYILCKAGLSSAFLGERSECIVSSRPSLSVYKLQVIAWTCTPLVISSFCWTSNTAHVWRLFIARVIGVPSSEGPKHRLTRDEAGVRAPFDACGRLSGSLGGQQFPGAKLALVGPCNTQAWRSQGVPQLMPPHLYTPGNNSLYHSAIPLPPVPLLHTDSERSISTRYSIESGFQYYSSSRQQRKGRMRRHSLDSQLSFHVSDIEREAARHTMVRFAAAAGGQQRASVHSYSSRTSRVSRAGRSGWLRRRFSRAREARRESYTSEDSSFSSVLVTGVGLGAEDTTLFSNMMRRLHLSSSTTSSPVPATVGDKQEQIVCAAAPLHTRATVGVQTSLEDGDMLYLGRLSPPPRVPQADKATQVSPSLDPHMPVFVDCHRTPRLFSETGSLRSSSEEDTLNMDGAQVAADWESPSKYLSLNDRITPNPGPISDDQHLDRYLRAPISSLNYLKRPPLDLSPRKDHGDSSKAKRRKRKHGSLSNGAVGRRGAVAETSFVDGADVLLSRENRRLNIKHRNPRSIVDCLQLYPHSTGDGRNSTKTKLSGGGRTSSMTGSRGTCLDAETISTVIDLEDFSDS